MTQVVREFNEAAALLVSLLLVSTLVLVEDGGTEVLEVGLSFLVAGCG